jgi:hypothetical protein
MMNSRFTFSLLFGTVLAATLTLLPSAEAQVIKHKVTPRVIDVAVEPRDILTETITIENLAPHKITVYPSVNEVAVDAGGDVTEFTPRATADNAVTVTSWLSISRAGVELMPGATTSLPLSIKIHPGAPAGTYHAFIGFGWGRNRDVAEAQVANGSAPGVVVTLSVATERTEFLKLTDFTVDRFIVGAGTNAVQYTLENPGEAPLIPRGEIILSDGRGQEVGSIPVNPDGVQIAAGGERQFTQDVAASGFLGRYKAFLTADYGQAQVGSVYGTEYFYVAPWPRLVLLFAVLLVTIFLLTYWLHRRSASGGVDIEDGAAAIPLYVRPDRSADKDHDINLKPTA